MINPINNDIKNNHNSSVIKFISILLKIWLLKKEVTNKMDLLMINPKTVPINDKVKPS